MSVATAVLVFNLFVTAYFVAWNALQFLMAVPAERYMRRLHRRRHPRNLALVDHLADPPKVSVITPARNEGLTIADSIRALLAMEYPAREIVVVNDGSTDDTLGILQRTFQLVEAPLAFEQPLQTAQVRAIYRSVADPALVVLDKVSAGSKADACNAGINAASGELVLVMDADTILEPDALHRAALPFLERRETVAVGGYVGIANGCRIEHGRVAEVTMPRSWLARFQIVEYMRSFLLFRLACAEYNGVAIISGAFGLFRRDAVIAVGGFDAAAIGEDMDLTVRIQRHYRRRKEKIRIGFVPVPACWTQVPEDRASLGAQRTRWRRGLLQVLWRHRGMICNPRYGIVGLGVMPWFLLFEALASIIEITGYVVTVSAWALGLLNLDRFLMLLAASILFGAATTLLGVFMRGMFTPHYESLKDLSLLVAAAVLESFGYRQLNAWWSCVGTVQFLLGKGDWGRMTRKAF